MIKTTTKKRITSLLMAALLLWPQITAAQQSTLLPEASETLEAIEDVYNNASNEQQEEWRDQGINNLCDYFFSELGGAETVEDSRYFRETATSEQRQDILSCAIKSGKIRMWMIPYFITSFANFFIGLAGTISVLFVLLGGFWYMTGGLTDDKEKGKKTITYALIGLGITLLAWIIVNIIQFQVTG